MVEPRGTATTAGNPLGASFWRLWTAAVTSRFGDAVRIPAFALLALSVTSNPRHIAAVTVAGQLPSVLFGVLGGVYADRWDRRRTMMLADTLKAVLVAAFAVAVASGLPGLWPLLACAFLLGTVGTLFDAAAFAILPSLVPADRLAAANGHLQAGTAAIALPGASAAGVLFVVATPLPFAVDAVTFAASALLLLGLRTAPPDGSGQPPPVGAWRAMADGLRWLWRARTLGLATVITAVSNLFIGGLIAVMVLLVVHEWGTPEAAYGAVMAMATAGMVVGSLLAGRIGRRWGNLPTLPVVLAVETAALIGLALAGHPLVGGALLAVFMGGTGVWNALFFSYGQRVIPTALLGRVGGAQRMACVAVAPVGALLAGEIAARWSVSVVLAAGVVLFVVLTAASWRPLRAPATPP
jgi:MFS family permease